ncbi:MAG: ribosomal protein S18-alanine N-acetyltransferase [Fimbriimonadaceae bacterium]|nr:ribosomal protein S18-alanine N-acetyltransferase [Fimbriimonadaceae bacterium]
MAEELLQVARAVADDVEGILLVERHCFGRTWTRQQYLTEIAGSPHTYPAVARLDGRVVGFGSVTCIGEQAYIPTLGVLATHRQCGIGSRLLQALLAVARRMGAREVVLEVRVCNAAARRLYEQHGFEQVAIRRDYYEEPPDDAVVMRLAWEESATEPRSAGAETCHAQWSPGAVPHATAPAASPPGGPADQRDGAPGL